MPKNWIWLPKKIYPDNQLTKFDALSDGSANTYTATKSAILEYAFRLGARLAIEIQVDIEE